MFFSFLKLVKKLAGKFNPSAIISYERSALQISIETRVSYVLLSKALCNEMKRREDVGTRVRVDVWLDRVDADVRIPELEDARYFFPIFEPIQDDG